jgi:Flp pilus assembly pilin Flp
MKHMTIEERTGQGVPRPRGTDGRCPLRRLGRRPGRRFGRRLRRRFADDRGAATAEYAITILAAVGFAGLLVALLKGDEVKSILSDLVHRALSGG